MSDPQNGYQPEGRPTRPSGEIPRRGYERGQTGQLRPSGTIPSPYQDEPRYQPPPDPRPPLPPPPQRGRERLPRDSGLYLPWWSLLILIVFVGAATFGLLVLVGSLSGNLLVEPTPRFIIVTNDPAFQPTAPSGANNAPPTAIPTILPSLVVTLPTVAPSDTPIPGGCLLNEEVFVTGTGGVGLNLRDEPGGDVQFIAKEGERLLVIDGPLYFDGAEWCQVRSVSQSSSFGWASLQFLLPANDGATTP